MNSEEVLELCLRDTAAGQATAAECAARFSDFPDLETQLRLAERLRAIPAPTLRPEVRRRQEAELRRYAQTLRRHDAITMSKNGPTPQCHHQLSWPPHG